ncbi:MAG: 50S ribosomal protein L32 [Firmicutes bacterium]|nr:50S ribosomal protein L32 [Candidatus Fermentithermobacillaceae bacterium]HON87546.1 50S ribosomal protein L32 [Bacillota bacterium]
MAVPKRRTSASKRDMRRASAWRNRLTSPNLIECPRCHSLTLSHRVCPECGYYKGRQVTKVKEK